MSELISGRAAAVIADAISGGAETSLAELATILDLDDHPVLSRAQLVTDFVAQFGLELVPSINEGEYQTPRALRLTDTADDPSVVIDSLTQAGEGPTVEFKGSMHVSMRDWEKAESIVEHPSLPGEVLKTICAFLNSDGGDLLVGVNDDGVPCCGINLDLKSKGWNLDKWELHFQSLVADRFHGGREVSPYLRTRMLSVQEVPIFHVSVMRRSSPSFVRKEKGKPYEFFVRSGPRTESLDLPSFYAHLRANGGDIGPGSLV